MTKRTFKDWLEVLRARLGEVEICYCAIEFRCLCASSWNKCAFYHATWPPICTSYDQITGACMNDEARKEAIRQYGEGR